jgi:hypothetical protein
MTKHEKSPAVKAFAAAKEAKKTAKEKLARQNTEANQAGLDKAKEKLETAARELNRERFENVAGARIFKAVTAIAALRNTSNRRAYEYTEADVSKMFTALEGELKTTKAVFDGALKAPKGKATATGPAKFVF